MKRPGTCLACGAWYRDLNDHVVSGRRCEARQHIDRTHREGYVRVDGVLAHSLSSAGVKVLYGPTDVKRPAETAPWVPDWAVALYAACSKPDGGWSSSPVDYYRRSRFDTEHINHRALRAAVKIALEDETVRGAVESVYRLSQDPEGLRLFLREYGVPLDEPDTEGDA